MLFRSANLGEDCYRRESENSILRERLEDAVRGELMAHLKYMMYADRARRRGLDRIATLFEALAASEYQHARNFYSVLENPGSFKEGAGEFAAGENFEHSRLYPMMAEYAGEQNSPLASQAYTAAAMAEKQHERLLKKAQEDMEG